MKRYREFYELCDELTKNNKKFDSESLKLLSFRDLSLACVGNAGSAACDWKLIEEERNRRIEKVTNLDIGDIEKDKGKWEILDDMHMYYEYYKTKAKSIHKKDAPKWRLLVDAMQNLRNSWSNGRNNRYLKVIYDMLPEVEEEGMVPLGWCEAVKMNADQFDGRFNDGRIMRDGALKMPEEMARHFGFPSTDASGNIAKMLGARGVVRESGYKGSYTELFEEILTPEQKIIYLSTIVESDITYK